MSSNACEFAAALMQAGAATAEAMDKLLAQEIQQGDLYATYVAKDCTRITMLLIDASLKMPGVGADTALHAGLLETKARLVRVGEALKAVSTGASYRYSKDRGDQVLSVPGLQGLDAQGESAAQPEDDSAADWSF